ncbi:MAG: GNAT family N-acetyltransferase [Clostridiaceae bacterium]|nr:GNAT family N-acetyltransferase [Clostridiaceae bacterium]
MSLRTALENVEPALWTDGRVSISPLKTEADLIYAAYECRLSEEQKELANPAWFSIGRAYLFREDNYPCIICNERMRPISFINLCKWLGEGDAYTWSFFIDRNYQGKGYGRSAAQAAIRILKAANPTKPIKLAAEKSNERTQLLYISLGFTLLPGLDGDDIVFGL